MIFRLMLKHYHLRCATNRGI